MPTPAPIPLLESASSEVRIMTFDFSLMPEIFSRHMTITGVIGSVVHSSPTGLTVGTPAVDANGVMVNVQISGGVSDTTYTCYCTVQLSDTISRLTGYGALLIKDH